MTSIVRLMRKMVCIVQCVGLHKISIVDQIVSKTATVGIMTLTIAPQLCLKFPKIAL